MNTIFDGCVYLLQNIAAYFGTTYKAINVWIFCIIEPIIFFIMLAVIYTQAKKIKQYKKTGLLLAEASDSL
jgi:hypothetical protein